MSTRGLGSPSFFVQLKLSTSVDVRKSRPGNAGNSGGGQGNSSAFLQWALALAYEYLQKTLLH